MHKYNCNGGRRLFEFFQLKLLIFAPEIRMSHNQILLFGCKILKEVLQLVKTICSINIGVLSDKVQADKPKLLI